MHERSIIRIYTIHPQERLNSLSSFAKATKKPRAIWLNRIHPEIKYGIFIIENVNLKNIVNIEIAKDILGH